MDLKKTALYEKHIDLGAKMVPFAGFYMPVSYTSLVEEHLAVRHKVGVFDVSHMGEFMVTGPQARDLVQHLTTNNVFALYDGKVQYSCMPNDQGGIVDDLLVYRIHEEQYLLVVNAANIQKDWDWISLHNRFDCSMEDLSDHMSLFAIQGPSAQAVVNQLIDFDGGEMAFYTFKTGRFAGHDNVIISATGYTGAGGGEIYVDNAVAPAVWDQIFAAGQAYDIQPVGLGARDTLRLEMGYCLYGNDIDDRTSPIEARLGWITKFNHPFINSETLKKQKEEGVSRKLSPFEMVDKAIPRQGYPILDASGNNIGVVTSGTQSPSLKKGIGLGYVDTPHHTSGTEVFVEIRNKRARARITKLPFYQG